MNCCLILIINTRRSITLNKISSSGTNIHPWFMSFFNLSIRNWSTRLTSKNTWISQYDKRFRRSMNYSLKSQPFSLFLKRLFCNRLTWFRSSSRINMSPLSHAISSSHLAIRVTLHPSISFVMSIDNPLILINYLRLLDLFL